MFAFMRRKKPEGRSPDKVLHAVADRLRDPALTSLQRALLKTIAAFCAPRIGANPISRWRAALRRARP